MPDLEKRVSNRRKKLQKVWQSKEWKDAVKAFVEDKGKCAWCGGTEYLTAHHPYQKSYAGDVYLNLYLSGCICLCRKCHAAVHHGLVLCPRCKKKYMRFESEMCFECFSEIHPEIVEAREHAKEVAKANRKAREKAYREKVKKKLEEEWENARKTSEG